MMEEAKSGAIAPAFQETALSLLDGRLEYGLMLCVPDEALTLLYTNQAVVRMLGLEGIPVGVAGENPVLARMTKSVREALKITISRLGLGDEGVRMEARFGGAEEMPVWALLSAYRLGNVDGSSMVAILMQNLTQLKWSQELLKQERNRNEIIASFSDQVLFEYAMTGSALLIECPALSESRALVSLFEFERDILTEEQIWSEDRTEFINLCARMLTGEERCEAELRLSNDQMTFRWVSLLARAVRNSAGQPIKYIGRLLDVHESKMELERLTHQAQRDSLTQLYNRSMIQGHIESQLEMAQSHGNGAVVILDIDNFKQINDQQGHFFGDFVLQSAADLLRDIGDTVPDAMAGRLGGDEFLLLLPNVSRQQIEQLMEKLLEDFGQIYRGAGTTLSCSFSIGIAEYPSCGSFYQQIFQKADAALYMVKSAGKAGYRFYDEAGDVLAPAEQQQYYNTYNMEESINDDSPSDARQQLVRMVSETLNQLPNLGEAVPLLLRVIGRRLSIDQLSIVEIDSNESAVYCSYQWTADGIGTEYGQYRWCPPEVMDALVAHFSKRALLAAEDVDRLDYDDAYIRAVRARKVRSFAHYAVYSEGSVRYLFQLEHYNDTRSWSRQDLSTIEEVSDALSNHLLRFQVQMQAREQLNRHLNYDSLTRLATLPKLIKDAETILGNWEDGSYAVIYADFSGFKQVNDQMGYVVGDQVLRDFADVVRLDCRADEQVCRVSGDVFLALLHNNDTVSLLRRVNQLRETFRTVMAERHQELEIKLSLGAYLIQRGENLMTAIDNANAARKMAKRLQTDHCLLFDEEMRRQAEIENMSQARLEKALEAGEFIVCYQPKVRLSDREVVGAEALVRWQHADGLLPPDRFIPAFETSGVITQLDYYVLNRVCDLLRRMIDRGERPVQISVNLSRRDCHVPNVGKELLAIIDRHGIPRQLLEFELTESIFIDPNETLKSLLRELLDGGCDVSIDDFGYGYSSLNILSQVPATVVKLDRAFLNSSDRDERSRYILEQMVSIARNVGLKVVCEGIEREAQAEFCTRIGCDLAQGFLFAYPMPEQELLEILKSAGR